MSDIENTQDESGEFSLAQLANFNADEVAEVRYESLPAGVYSFIGRTSKLEKTTNREGETRFVLIIGLEVEEVKAVTERGVDKESLVGKKHTERMYIVPAKAEEGIGLIRAFYADAGLPNNGAIGSAEDEDGNPLVGFTDGIVDHVFTAKIVKVARKDDPSMKDARLRFK